MRHPQAVVSDRATPDGVGSGAARAHILTVSVEEYFHAGALKGAVRRKHWDRLESRVERSVDDVLEWLDDHRQQATFFVLGCIAERHPQLLARIVEGGHEVAASGYWPHSAPSGRVDEFREDLRRSRQTIEAASGRRVLGYRAPLRWLGAGDLWVLDVLAEEGFVYDSSLNPGLQRFKGMGDMRGPRWHPHASGSGGVWELPIATVSVLGWRVAVSGGNYLRQLPHTVLKRAVAHLDRTRSQPMVFYFMPWELDRDQPHVSAVSRLTRVRQYRNLGKSRWVFEEYFRRFRFQSAASHLGLAAEAVTAVVTDQRPDPAAAVVGTREDVSLVVPLYNEEANVAYLRRSLCELRGQLAARYRVHLVLVDDGSTDGTWREMEHQFATEPACRLVRQPRNGGVASAILTGIRQAPTEVVATIDCDCSYDPQELVVMFPLIEGADIVSASPYHPLGHVLNVPAWRLLLSKTLSRLYTAALGTSLYTYTSCCRVYRRSALEGVELKNGGFLGIAELLVSAIQRGAVVVEHPATLESRLFGESKMKVARTIGGHLGLLGGLVSRRVLGTGGRPSSGNAAAGRS